MPKTPTLRSSSKDVARFLKQKKDITEYVSKQPRLLFAIDATASRQPTWDTASHLQAEMFSATNLVASLRVQLCYYRGFHDFYASQWLSDSQRVAAEMASVACEGGHTQIVRLLRHGLAEHAENRIRALVFIGDAIEESPDALCDMAGQSGLLGLPLFLFQEGNDPRVTQTFTQMAKLSHGAFARFDQSSANRLASLLGAVASYAVGGRKALARDSSEGAKLLLKQLDS
ncbi:MAG: VWA domain-containing protein [Halioglobus sp.]